MQGDTKTVSAGREGTAYCVRCVLLGGQAKALFGRVSTTTSSTVPPELNSSAA
jgi:hypothetical protein